MEFVQVVESHENRRAIFQLFPIGDVHYGTVLTDEERLDHTIDFIKRHEYARWVGMGELCDLIVPGDKRYDPGMMAPWVDEIDVAKSECEYALEKLIPIKDKCWGLLNDNHTEGMRLRTNRDVYSDLVRGLGVNRLGFSCFLNVSFIRDSGHTHPSVVIHFWLHHGWFAGRLMGETALNLERLGRSYDADIYIVAHGHKGLIMPLNYLTARWADDHGNRPIEMLRWAMMTQHWLNANKCKAAATSWQERRGFWPQPVGCPIIRIKPSARHIEVASSGTLTQISIPEKGGEDDATI